jgi:hypothetical protein
VSLSHVTLAMTAGTLAVFLLLQAVALAVALRRPPASTKISLQARLTWTLVPLITVALLLGSLLATGRMSL